MGAGGDGPGDGGQGSRPMRGGIRPHSVGGREAGAHKPQSYGGGPGVGDGLGSHGHGDNVGYNIGSNIQTVEEGMMTLEGNGQQMGQLGGALGYAAKRPTGGDFNVNPQKVDVKNRRQGKKTDQHDVISLKVREHSHEDKMASEELAAAAARDYGCAYGRDYCGGSGIGADYEALDSKETKGKDDRNSSSSSEEDDASGVKADTSEEFASGSREAMNERFELVGEDSISSEEVDQGHSGSRPKKNWELLGQDSSISSEEVEGGNEDRLQERDDDDNDDNGSGSGDKQDYGERLAMNRPGEGEGNRGDLTPDAAGANAFHDQDLVRHKSGPTKVKETTKKKKRYRRVEESTKNSTKEDEASAERKDSEEEEKASEATTVDGVSKEKESSKKRAESSNKEYEKEAKKTSKDSSGKGDGEKYKITITHSEKASEEDDDRNRSGRARRQKTWGSDFQAKDSAGVRRTTEKISVTLNVIRFAKQGSSSGDGEDASGIGTTKESPPKLNLIRFSAKEGASGDDEGSAEDEGEDNEEGSGR